MEESEELCAHFDEVKVTTSDAEGCEECIKIGSEWVHLRLCLVCGNVGCCDNSPNKHASKHAKKEEHPIMQSFEPTEDWVYCFIDDVISFDPPAALKKDI